MLQEIIPFSIAFITGVTFANYIIVKKASVKEIAEVFHTSQAFRHEKRADELLTLAQNSVGIQLVSHHVWRQSWLLEQLDMLETARSHG